jgi:hypothetical protein
MRGGAGTSDDRESGLASYLMAIKSGETEERTIYPIEQNKND